MTKVPEINYPKFPTVGKETGLKHFKKKKKLAKKKTTRVNMAARKFWAEGYDRLRQIRSEDD